MPHRSEFFRTAERFVFIMSPLRVRFFSVDVACAYFLSIPCVVALGSPRAPQQTWFRHNRGISTRDRGAIFLRTYVESEPCLIMPLSPPPFGLCLVLPSFRWFALWSGFPGTISDSSPFATPTTSGSSSGSGSPWRLSTLSIFRCALSFLASFPVGVCTLHRQAC